MFNKTYKGKKVLVTGHTGFKGTWLSLWLMRLGADVYGISNAIPTEPSLFSSLDLSSKMTDRRLDINNAERLSAEIASIQPDFIFHAAAQAIVGTSYSDPVDTIKTNVIGTANVLESVRKLNLPCTVILVSSDKCYENREWIWGYRENERMGGKDIYSASKGAMEIIIHAYYHSFFRQEHSCVKIASARAGNVIGGGDWAERRIVPDCFRAWAKGLPVELRNPGSTRPWQHVLDPLSGYLRIGALLNENTIHNGEAYNFGPVPSQNFTVKEMLDALSGGWEFGENEKFIIRENQVSFHEADLLKLNCEKAARMLNWEPTLNFHEAVNFTSSWYKQYYQDKSMIDELTSGQLEKYIQLAKERGKSWII
jgi:CDP-glucose 4,6-dehydratase